MVQFIDKNPSDYRNHMMTQHKAFFSIELSLACSVMDKKEGQTIIRRHILHIKQEDEVLFKEDQIKQENIFSMEEKAFTCNRSDILKGEYIESEEIFVKEEDTTQDSSVLKPFPESLPKSIDVSKKAVLYKRPAEELLTEYEPKLMKKSDLAEIKGKQEFMKLIAAKVVPSFSCSFSGMDGKDCPQIRIGMNAFRSHNESAHSRIPWIYQDVMVKYIGKEGRLMNMDNIEMHSVDVNKRDEHIEESTADRIKRYFKMYCNTRIKKSLDSIVPKYALVSFADLISCQIYIEPVSHW